MKTFYLLILMCLMITSTSRAQNRVYVNEYLNIGVGAKGLGMAGAQSAVSNDVTAAYYNVAGLTQIQSELELGLMHAEYFSGNAKYDYAGVAVPTRNKKSVFALSFTRFATDNIPYTLDIVEPDGNIDYSKLKSISAGDYSFLLSFAQKVKLFKNPEFKTSYGLNAKVIYRNIGSMANAWGVGVDAGIQTRYKQWMFGIMAKDITTTYTNWAFNLTEHEKEVFGATGNKIPVHSYEIMYPRFNVGLAKNLIQPGKKIQVLLALDGDLTTDGRRGTPVKIGNVSLDPHMGFEASYKNTIYLRGGVGNFQKVKDDTDTTNTNSYTIFQPSVGVGLRLKSILLDYAYTSLQTQSNPLLTHVISLRLDMNFAKKQTPENLDIEE